MTVDLEFLGKQTERILSELRQMRQDLSEVKIRLSVLSDVAAGEIERLQAQIERYHAPHPPAHYPAAFIDALAEKGTKEEAVEWLQKKWDENCELRNENERLRTALRTVVETPAPPSCSCPCADIARRALEKKPSRATYEDSNTRR
jgi:hypothetical protein